MSERRGAGSWGLGPRVPPRLSTDCVAPRTHARTAPGTLITGQRDMSSALMTSIVLKSNVTLVDICSTRMLGQYGFLAKVFTIMEANQISVDVVVRPALGGNEGHARGMATHPALTHAAMALPPGDQ